MEKVYFQDLWSWICLLLNSDDMLPTFITGPPTPKFHNKFLWRLEFEEEFCRSDHLSAIPASIELSNGMMIINTVHIIIKFLVNIKQQNVMLLCQECCNVSILIAAAEDWSLPDLLRYNKWFCTHLRILVGSVFSSVWLSVCCWFNWYIIAFWNLIAT